MQVSPRPLHFGVLTDEMYFEKWQIRTIEKILETGESAFSQIIVCSTGRDYVSKLSPFSKLWANSTERRHAKFDAAYASVPVTYCSVTREGNTVEYFQSDDVKRIARLELDFIIQFGSRTAQGEILTTARYGVWRFRHGSGGEGIDCFWEVYRDDNVTWAVLEKIEELPKSPVVLRTGCFKTLRTSYSRNLDQILSGSSDLPAKACVEIINGNTSLITSSPVRLDPQDRNSPKRVQVWLLSLKTIKRRIEAAYRLLFRYTTWNFGIVDLPIQSFLTPGFKPKVRWFPESKNGHIQADPFGRATEGRVTVLFERLDYLHRKGTICAVELNDGFPPPTPSVVMELPVHMSYPYIFEHNGETYCIPETNQAREVSIFRATPFPSQWTKVGCLLSNIRAIDTTVFQHDGRWWLTCTDRERGGDANLYVWHAPDLWGPWTPHPLNPVKTDVRSARPGGTPFEYMGRLYRPAQDCSITGGGRIVLNRVEQLTPTEFSEKPMALVEPFEDGVYKDGMHTLSAAGEFTLVDGKRFRFVPSGFLSNIARGLKRMRRL